MKDRTKKTINFLTIIFVFALTGTTTAILSGVVMGFISTEPWTVEYVLGYIFLIFPLYHALLLGYAFVLGKFNFFYSRQKKISQKLFLSIKKLFGKIAGFLEINK